jgi:putative membrane protein
VLSAVAVFVLAQILPGVHILDYWSAVKVAIVLAFLNAIVKPVLTVLTIPITIVTLGLFLLVINALIIIFAEKLVDGFHVDGFLTAIIFSLCLSLFSGFLNMVFGVNKKQREE